MGLGVIADSILIANCCTDQLHDSNRSYSREYDSHACDRVVIDNMESLSALVISLSCHIMVLVLPIISIVISFLLLVTVVT